MLAECTGAPPTTAGLFSPGCIIIRTDAGEGVSGVYQNDGTTASPSWNLIGSIAAGEIGLATGSILVGAAGVAAALDAKTSGRILIGNGTTVVSVAVSGDVTISAAGAVTIANDAINKDKLNYETVTVQITGAASGTATATTGSEIIGWHVTAVTGTERVKTVDISGTTVTVVLSGSDTATVKVTLIKA